MLVGVRNLYCQRACCHL